MPVILVTGASSGIGRACAARFSRSGHAVYGGARSLPGAGETPFRQLCLDVREDGSAGECVKRILQEAGRIDVLVNCAGVVVAGAVEEMLTEEIRQQVETNLLGTMRMCRAVLPSMRRQGSGLIINVGSLGGLMGMPFQSAYCASKYGVEGFSECLQMEVRRFGIRVVVLDPGDVRTAITMHRGETRGTGPDSPYRDMLEAVMRSQALGEERGWDPERIARVIEGIIRSRRPRFRCTPGPLIERVAPAARRLIPDRLFLRIIARFYGLR